MVPQTALVQMEYPEAAQRRCRDRFPR